MRLMKDFGRRLAAVSAIAATTFGVIPAAQAKDARPAMWKVADHDTTIYLFGTIHLLPANLKWRSAAFDKAAASSDTLVIETDVDESNPAATLGELFKLAVSPGLPPLVLRVKPEKRAALAAMVAKSGIPAATLDGIETWAAAFLLLGVQFKDLGLEPGSGVETALKKQFVDRGKPIGQLESNADQLGIFDKLSEQAQREFLEGMLDDPSSMKGEFQVMLDAWSRGDIAGVAKSFNGDMGEAPELMDALIARRNANWAKWVEGRMETPGTVMMAVGAGHLAGDKSVVKMLQKQGLKVTRVQ